MLDALLRAGRWDDAAAYGQSLDELDPADRAALLLAIGGPDEADALLGSDATGRDEPTPWARFLRNVAASMRGDGRLFPNLVTESAQFGGHFLTPLLMFRSADVLDQRHLAAHFAWQVLRVNAGDPDAAQVVALDLVEQGDYVDATKVFDRAEAVRCADERSALQEVLDRLRVDRAKVDVLVSIGRHRHREKDPTVPVSEAARAARDRWRRAHRTFGVRHWGRRLAWLGTAAVTVGSLLAFGNALPGLAAAIVLGAWLRLRPLPGLDRRTSQLVRAVSDPRTILLARRYRVFDVVTFVFAIVTAGGLATGLPHGPGWLDALEVIAVLAVAGAATRGRRRWLRLQAQRVLRSPYDPAFCCCLDVPSMQGPQSRDYVEQHLFRAGAVSGLPSWQVLQCLDTHVRFLSRADADLTIRLAPEQPA